MLEALREFTMVHAMSAERRQVAADLWNKPISLNHKLACRLPVNYTQHRQFIFTQPKSWYSFYHPTDGKRLSRQSWLATYRDGLPARTRSPIQVLTGPGVGSKYVDRDQLVTAKPRHQPLCQFLNSYCSYKSIHRSGRIIYLRTYGNWTRSCSTPFYSKKAVLPQGNRAMPQLFFSVLNAMSFHFLSSSYKKVPRPFSTHPIGV